MNECPRDGDCFGCVDRGTDFCPLEENDDYDLDNNNPFCKYTITYNGTLLVNNQPIKQGCKND
ncbi:MAG: hypothetical protein WCO84_00995 [bacterium]